MSDAVVWGLGELGAVFSRGLLRTGRAVFPVVRSTQLDPLASRVPDPEVVLVAVGESDLDGVLAAMPLAWRGRVALLQNELRPRDWERHAIDAPTLAVVWFEKKRGTDVRVLLPTVVSGSAATPLLEALAALGVAAERAEADAAERADTDAAERAEADAAERADTDAALGALAAKNLYILVTNLAGMLVGGDVGALLGTHRALALEVARDVLDLETALFAPHAFSRAEALEVLERAGAADPQHACMGRSAPVRLARSLAHADRLGLAVPTLRRIAREALKK